MTIRTPTVALLFVLSLTSSAQIKLSAETADKTAGTHPASSAARIERFNELQDRLPPEFTGTSVVSIFNAVYHRKDLLKSEFESEAQYRARLQDLTRSPLFGDFPLQGTLAFSLNCHPLYPRDPCDRYDADSGIMYVDVDFSSVGPNAQESPGNSQPVFVSIKDNSGPVTRAGVALNGYGAKFAIGQQSVTRYAIEYIPPQWLNDASLQSTPGEGFEITPGDSNPRFQLKMSSASAALAKGNIRELIIGYLTPPFLGRVEDAVNEPRSDFRVRTSMHIRSVHMDIEEVWFYNIRTGEIYRKIRPK